MTWFYCQQCGRTLRRVEIKGRLINYVCSGCGIIDKNCTCERIEKEGGYIVK